MAHPGVDGHHFPHEFDHHGRFEMLTTVLRRTCASSSDARSKGRWSRLWSSRSVVSVGDWSRSAPAVGTARRARPSARVSIVDGRYERPGGGTNERPKGRPIMPTDSIATESVSAKA